MAGIQVTRRRLRPVKNTQQVAKAMSRLWPASSGSE